MRCGAHRERKRERENIRETRRAIEHVATACTERVVLLAWLVVRAIAAVSGPRARARAGSGATCRCLIFSVCEITERHKLPIGQVADKWSGENGHIDARTLATACNVCATRLPRIGIVFSPHLLILLINSCVRSRSV